MRLLIVFCSVSILAVSPAVSEYTYETKYATVKVDHFNFFNNDSFKLRYLENSTHWRPEDGAPILFYTGNEGDITVFAQNTGFMWDIAEEFKALIIFAEHRYYGESMPYGNKSLDDLTYSGYLSSSQALADFVDVIRHVKSSHQVTQNKNPVILFGGSYGGMLSAWFRMKYPDEAIGALASSAPIWQFEGLTPCDAFYNVVSSVYKKTSQDCFNKIQQSWGQIDYAVSQEGGMKSLTDKYKLCSPLKIDKDVTNLKNWFNDIWVNLAMTNYPYPTNFLSPLPGNPVKAACSYMKSDGDILDQVFAGAGVFFNFTGAVKCLDTSSGNGVLGDTWDFQSCTEMVMPMCASEGSMFEPSEWNFDKFAQGCEKLYKVWPQQFLVEKLYGGRNIKAASNIIFSNGLLDPWSSGGVMNNLSKTLRAVVIPDSAHHLDLRSKNPLDPVSVIYARNYYKYVFRSWIKEYHKKNMIH